MVASIEVPAPDVSVANQYVGSTTNVHDIDYMDSENIPTFDSVFGRWLQRRASVTAEFLEQLHDACLVYDHLTMVSYFSLPMDVIADMPGPRILGKTCSEFVHIATLMEFLKTHLLPLDEQGNVKLDKADWPQDEQHQLFLQKNRRLIDRRWDKPINRVIAEGVQRNKAVASSRQSTASKSPSNASATRSVTIRDTGTRISVLTPDPALDRAHDGRTPNEANAKEIADAILVFLGFSFFYRSSSI